MMKLAIAAAMLMASLLTISAPAEACGYGKADTAKVYGKADTAKVYGRSKRPGYCRRGPRVYDSRASICWRSMGRTRVFRRRRG